MVIGPTIQATNRTVGNIYRYVNLLVISYQYKRKEAMAIEIDLMIFEMVLPGFHAIY